MILSTGLTRRLGSGALRKCRHSWERFYYRTVARRRPGRGTPVWRRRLCCAGDGTASLYERLFPGSTEARIFEADLICDHLFDLLGSGPVRLGAGGPYYQPLDWHRDFRSGHRWNPRTFHRDIRYSHIHGVDVKIPWELSRFQHLGRLGQAYVLTGRPKYRAEFVHQIDDWIAANPVGFGVNWACTMDVAIRAANWLVWAECFLGDGGLDPQFLRRLYASLHEHGRFIRSHLEHGQEGPANHYLADVAGLLFIAIYCPRLRESRRWRRFCIRELIRQMDVQVYADGCHFEASTCYHRLALELFFFAALLVGSEEGATHAADRFRIAEKVFGATFMARLHAMFVAVLHLLKPNGRMPQIGDNDSGRFLVFGAGDPLDMRYLLALGAVFFNDPQLKIREYGPAEDVLWLFEKPGADAWDRLAERSLATVAGKAFPDAGWYVIRHRSDYCLVSCGPNGGHGRGGHAHNDKLSIELALDGRDLIVDPGACCYTSDPDQRNRFRSTESHNTLVVDRCEQSALPADLFRLPDGVRIRRVQLAENPQWSGFIGAIEYGGIVHERTVGVDKSSGAWGIEDHVSSDHAIGGKVAFHLAPGLRNHREDIFEEGGKIPIARFESRSVPVETGTYRYSPQYGVAVEAQSLCVPVPDLTNITIQTAFSRRCEDTVVKPKSLETPTADHLPVLRTMDVCTEAV